MITLMVVVIDEGFDLGFKITLQEVVFQQDAVLQGLMPPLDLALGLWVIRRTTRVLHALAKARSATVTHALLKQQLAKRLRHIECDIAKIDAVMLALAHKDQQMSERLEILSSIPGIGIRTALMILVDMPEISVKTCDRISSLSSNQTALFVKACI
jgi:transposase